MKFASATVLVLALSASGLAFAGEPAKDYDPAVTRCPFADDGDLQRVVKNTLDYADQVLPNVPPEEEKYLTAESEAARKVYEAELDQNGGKSPANGQGNMRYAALERRPLYDVWKLRKDIFTARQAIQDVLTPRAVPPTSTYRKNPEAEKLERAARSIGAVNAYVILMSEFLTKQNNAAQPLITSDQYLRLLDGIYSLPSDLGNYMDCKLAKVMGRQSFY